MDLEIFSNIKDKSIHATDGDIGKVNDFYFDDSLWTTRYLVVDTGHWLTRQSVLLSPVHIKDSYDWQTEYIPVDLTKEKIKNSPSVESAKPVSRQMEVNYWDYYGYPYYWGLPGIWGSGMYPINLYDHSLDRENFKLDLYRRNDDPHLRSANEVCGYTLDTTDGSMGSVQDLVLDRKTWSIRYIEVDTVKWWPSKKVLLSVDWISEIDWNKKVIKIDLKKDQIKGAPSYDAGTAITREYEELLHSYYGKLNSHWRELDKFGDRNRAA